MKDIIVVVIAQAPSIICITASAILANKGVSSWGWFLLVGVLVAATKIRVSWYEKIQ